MKRNASRTNKSLSDLKIWILCGIAFVVLGSFAYTTITKAGLDKRVSQLAGTASEQELAIVRNCDAADGEMLHYPGFDVYFSNNHRQPYYVSWILTPEHVREVNVKRSDKFRPDPDVANSAQLADYRHSGYDRGHMAPSADFRYSKEAQEATFFLTNMCPQHNLLNTQAWARLEEQCRNWALRDSTLIIIAGPVLSDYLENTIGENKVTVPDRFFKVVFAPYADPPRAIGFVMPNHKVEGGVQPTEMPVDNVEAITGYDFFSALPDEIEEIIESRASYHEWQKKQKKQK